MQADVGIGPYEGNRPYPKGEGFGSSKRDGAAGRHGTRGKYAAGGGQNGQQDIGHTQGGSQQVPGQRVTGDAPPQGGVQGQRRRDSQHGHRRRRLPSK